MKQFELSCYCLGFLCLVLGACGAVQGGASKCPPNAICAWLDFGVGPIYICTDPAGMTQLRAVAKKESFE
jgi:hypothetical protein